MNTNHITLPNGVFAASLTETQHLHFFKDKKTGALIVQAFDRTKNPSYDDPVGGIALTTKAVRPEKVEFETCVSHILERPLPEGKTVDEALADLLAEGEQQLKYTTMAFGTFATKALPLEETKVSCMATDCAWRKAEPEDEDLYVGEEYSVDSSGREFTFDDGHIIRVRAESYGDISVYAIVEGAESFVTSLRSSFKLYSVTFTVPVEYTITVAAADEDDAERCVEDLGGYEAESVTSYKDGEYDWYSISVSSVDYEGEDTDHADVRSN